MQFRQYLTRYLCALVLFATGAISALADDDDDEGDGFVPNQVMVKLVQAADLQAVATQWRLDPRPLERFGTRPIFLLRIVDGVSPIQRAEELKGDGRVLYAEPNYVAQSPESRQKASWAIGGESADYAGQWAPRTMRTRHAHTITRGAGVTVAVLDTGIDAQHPALKDRLRSGYDFVDDDANPAEVGVHGRDVAYGHGTHVAGLIALTAPEATIMPVRVLDQNGLGNVWVLGEALLYAADPDRNPATNDGADVINLSIGTSRETNLLEEIVREISCADDDDDDDDDRCVYSRNRGVVISIAAGNNGRDRAEYPAAEKVPGTFGVAATTSQDTLALFSNYGSGVTIAAPGQNILSSVPGGKYGTWSGTSMAAPLVAGHSALVRSAYPTMRATEIVERTISTATDIGGNVSRRIDAAAALGIEPNAFKQLHLPLVLR